MAQLIFKNNYMRDASNFFFSLSFLKHNAIIDNVQNISDSVFYLRSQQVSIHITLLHAPMYLHTCKSVQKGHVYTALL